MFNVVTIAREYGSGGAQIGRRVAEIMKWELVDRQIIEQVASMGKIDPEWAAGADEQSSRWWENLLAGFRHGGPEFYIGDPADNYVDRNSLQQFTSHIIEEAGKAGNCVIIGRGSQFVLRTQPQALRVLIYAPVMEKIERIKQRHPQEHDPQALLRRMDAERVRYVQSYFGGDSRDWGHYHLCLNSTLGMDMCAELIVSTIRLCETNPEKQMARAKDCSES